MTAAAWWSGTAVGLDFETDGPDPLDARIITCNITSIAPGEKPFSLDWLVKPERDIPQGAIDVHGITTEHAREFGLARETAVADIATALVGACESVPVVGHNVSYDLTVLDREMRRLGLGSVGTDEPSGLVALRVDGVQVATFPVIDTLVLDKALDRYRKGPPEGGRNKLTETARVYGVAMGDAGAHDASADVIASLRIAWRIASMCRWSPTALCELYADRKRPSALAISFGGLADMSLTDLHHLQVKWAAEQADGLRQYFTEQPDKGDPAGVSGAWPVRPIETISTTERI